ncbi:MAG TPA: BON domain-containing protein [Ktedonobacterales bacterium]
MSATSGPVHYIFLLRANAGQDGASFTWPPTEAASDGESTIAEAAQLVADEGGWRVAPLAELPAADAIPENALVVTRDSEFTFTDPRAEASAQLLALRVEQGGVDVGDVLTHLVVLPVTGAGKVAAQASVVPAAALVLTEYAERGGRSMASLGIRGGTRELAEMPVWLPDSAVQQSAEEAVDRAVLLPHARHLITLETHAGRVALHGRAELESYADAAETELLASPGVVDVANHLLVDESFKDTVDQALAAAGISSVYSLAEHRLISLHGVVDDEQTRRKAEDVARKVTGVQGVLNRIAVRAAEVERL